MEQVGSRVSGTEDKVKKLDQTVKRSQKMLKNHKWNVQDT
jgi:hypothetical protein